MLYEEYVSNVLLAQGFSKSGFDDNKLGLSD